MTGPTSSPRGEHAPRPGVNWEAQLILHGEILVDHSGDLPRFLNRDLEPPTEPAAPPEPRPNRATRRAIARAARRKTT